MNRRPDRASITPPVQSLPNCTGCGACVAACLQRALSLASELPGGRGRKRVVVEAARCTGCGTCAAACPREALVLMEISPKIELCK